MEILTLNDEQLDSVTGGAGGGILLKIRNLTGLQIS